MQLRSRIDQKEKSTVLKDSDLGFVSEILFDVDAATATVSQSSDQSAPPLSMPCPHQKKAKHENQKEQEKKSDCENDYIESAQQLKMRLHSHLLTGRVKNKSLLTFAKEVGKKLYEQSKNTVTEKNFAKALDNNSKTFRKAQRKASRVIQRSTRSILKQEVDKTDRYLRLQKRRALRSKTEN